MAAETTEFFEAAGFGRRHAIRRSSPFANHPRSRTKEIPRARTRSNCTRATRSTSRAWAWRSGAGATTCRAPTTRLSTSSVLRIRCSSRTSSTRSARWRTTDLPGAMHKPRLARGGEGGKEPDGLSSLSQRHAVMTKLVCTGGAQACPVPGCDRAGAWTVVVWSLCPVKFNMAGSRMLLFLPAFDLAAPRRRFNSRCGEGEVCERSPAHVRT